MSINQVVISGNLTRDPELRSTASGTPVLQFSIAVNERRKNTQSGEWEDYANYIDCTMFGNRANSLQQILHRGTKVVVAGKLRYHSWQDQQSGNKRSKLDVIADDVDVMSTPKSAQNAPGQAYLTQAYPMPQQSAQAPQAQPPQAYAQPVAQQIAMPMPTAQPQQAPTVYDADIPF